MMQARVVEDARYAATGGKHPETGKNLSRRPDTLARKNMDTANESINRWPVAGHVPGVAIGDRSAVLVRCQISVGLFALPPAVIFCKMRDALSMKTTACGATVVWNSVGLHCLLTVLCHQQLPFFHHLCVVFLIEPRSLFTSLQHSRNMCPEGSFARKEWTTTL